MRLKNNYIKAFTLIELLVAIAIISLLTTIILFALQEAKAKSRDAKRISDIASLQQALRLYFENCNRYPPVLDTIVVINGSNVHRYSPDLIAEVKTCSGYPFKTYIAKIPIPPTTDPADYYYYDIDQSSGDDYRLKASLELNNAVLQDTRHDSPLLSKGVLSCTQQGPDRYDYCVGPK